MQSTRILIATPLYAPEIGGPATYVQLLESGLQDYGLDVTAIPFSRVRRYPKILRHLMYFYVIYKASKRADIILALDPVSTGLPALWAAQMRRVPFIVKVVGDYAWEQGTQRFGIIQPLDVFLTEKKLPLPVSLLRIIQTYVARSATAVLVPSHYLKKVVNIWGVTTEKITVVYNSIENNEEGKVPPEVERAARPLVLTAGRLVPWKNISGVIQAMHSVPDATLLIAGDGPERSALEKEAMATLPDRCIFLGALSHNNLRACMRASDVFILNSSYEGLSHVLLEALSVGLPVVATRAGGNTELVHDGVNALLVDVGRSDQVACAVGQILNSPTLARSLSDQAKLVSTRFSTERMMSDTAGMIHASV